MHTRPLQWLLVGTFAVALGHLTWHAVVGPPPAPAYFVGGAVEAMRGVDAQAKNLYLRRTLHLSQQPRHAWIQVLGRDLVLLHVNGRLIEQAELPSYPVAIVADLTTHLKPGRNVIAVTARQSDGNAPPAVAVSGAYTLSDGDHPLGVDDEWRCSSVFERKASWWFEPEFDDRHWPVPVRRTEHLRAEARTPPRASQTACRAPWIGATSDSERAVALRREFSIPQRPRQAWLRVAATSSYRLAVNGIVLDQREDQLGTAAPVPAVLRIYDITPLLQTGGNCISLVLTATATPPRVRVDAEVEAADGTRVELASGPGWQCRPAPAPDWLDGTVAEPTAWQPCLVEAGELSIPSEDLQRQTIAVVLPTAERWRRAAGQLGVIALLALLTALACRTVERRLLGESAQRLGAVYLALVPATAGIAIGLLAGFDPRVAAQDIYQISWVLLAGASVLLLWTALAVVRRGRWRAARPVDPAWSRLLTALGPAAALALLLVAGFWLRFRDLETEPLHWDEVSVYTITEGFRERGFPSNWIRPDMPVVYLNTNELAHVFTGLSSLVFNDPRIAVRFPGVCWNVLTIGLLYVAGVQLFRTRWVGLTAAAIFAFSPVVIAVSTFGRYFGPLQFFTLLTVLGFARIVGRDGAINHRALWLTAVSFVAVFLTWEGGGLIAAGLIVAGLLLHRRQLAAVLRDPQVWCALTAVAAVVALQLAHRTLQQTQSIWFGISASDADMRPLWRYAVFQPWYYVFESSWNQDALVPLLLLGGAALLALRHPWWRPLRLLFLFYLTVCLVTSSLLSIIAWRYTHHLTPVAALLGAATVVAAAQGLIRFGRRRLAPLAERVGVRLIAGGLAAAVLVVGSGWLLELPKMELFRVQGYSLRQFKYVNVGGPNLFLKDHVRDGDVVLAHQPYTTNFFLGRPRTDYWLQTTLYMTETLDERQPRAIDRRDGTPLIGSLQALENLFATHERIWYVLTPSGHSSANRAEVSAFLREHMDVAYEDYKTLVLFRDRNHRPASLRQDSQEALRQAAIDFLP